MPDPLLGRHSNEALDALEAQNYEEGYKKLQGFQHHAK